MSQSTILFWQEDMTPFAVEVDTSILLAEEEALYARLGMKTVGNGRENPSTVPATVFFGRERKRKRKNRTGKRNRYYGISGTESIGREHADYDRESITQNGKIHTTTSNI